MKITDLLSTARCFIAQVVGVRGLAVSLSAVAADQALFLDEARMNARKAQPLLVHARQWLAEEVRQLDPQSGLLTTPPANKVWNTRATPEVNSRFSKQAQAEV